MAKMIPKIVMWLVWGFSALSAMLTAHYLTIGVSLLNSFARPIGVYAIGMFLFPILICGLGRLWISRIRNPWLVLLPYSVGVFFALIAGLFGVYLLPEYCIVFQALSAVLFLVYFPKFVSPQGAAPASDVGNAQG